MARILIVDDSDVIRRLLSEYFSELGHEVFLAVDGQQGINMALSGDYHVVVCDIHMPKKNGYQVFSEVTHQLPGLPFIMTDSLPDDLADKALAEGAVAILTKPFDLPTLQQTLCSILKKSGSRV